MGKIIFHKEGLEYEHVFRKYSEYVRIFHLNKITSANRRDCKNVIFGARRVWRCSVAEYKSIEDVKEELQKPRKPY
jgi:hypothetical protein